MTTVGDLSQIAAGDALNHWTLSPDISSDGEGVLIILSPGRNHCLVCWVVLTQAEPLGKKCSRSYGCRLL